MLRRTLVLVTVLALSMTMGCTTVQRWMAGGAVVGGTVGGVLGAHHGEAGLGVLIGGLGGATAGALVGDMIDEKREKALVDDLNRQIADLKAENDRLKNQLAAKEQELANANRRIADLEAELNNLRKTARIPALEITLASDVLFRSGSAILSAEGKTALDGAAQKITSTQAGKFIMIEGHTDAQPIRASSWKSNWELGSARSLTVLHYLVDKGVDPAMLSAATFSKYQPVATNDSKEGRAKNRRSVIVLYTNWPKPVVQ